MFEQALLHRKPYAILIDEAEHIAKAARGSKLLDQLDHLKSLAIMTRVVHVLVGTYDLMVFRNLSAQLSRRSIDVHFSRYRATSEPEVRAFKGVLWRMPMLFVKMIGRFVPKGWPHSTDGREIWRPACVVNCVFHLPLG